MRTLTVEEYKKRYGQNAYGSLQVMNSFAKNPGQGFTERLKKSAQAGFEKVKQGLTQSFSGQDPLTPISVGLKIGAGIIETAFSPVSAAMEPIVKPTLGRGINYVSDKISDSPAVQRFATSKMGQATSRIAEDVGNLATVAGTIGGFMQAPKVGVGIKTGAGKTAGAIEKGVQRGIQTGKQLVTKGKQAIEPTPPGPVLAMKQVLQGQTKDVKAGFRAMKEIDTAGVKSYSDLLGRVNTTIKNLSKNVDETLDNTIPIKLSELKFSGSTKLGQTVKTDYVSRAITQLKEMYKSVGDDVMVKNMEDLFKTVKTRGLTRKEVNDLSRNYGSEFGKKAFGKTGEPLTSVSAVKFENTRSGLKNVARQGMKGTKAEAIDENISSLYRVQDLVKKNVEAVNALAQKIQERGLLEKIGYKATKVADILTGGSLRGMIGGILPRGVGYKVMNALDLEQVLQRNLEIIKNALEKGDDATLMKLLNDNKSINP